MIKREWGSFISMESRSRSRSTNNRRIEQDGVVRLRIRRCFCCPGPGHSALPGGFALGLPPKQVQERKTVAHSCVQILCRILL